MLLSHLHADHTDLPSLRMLPPATPIIAPAGSGAWLRARGLSDVRELQLHETVEVGALRVVAKLAVHDGRRAPFGPRAESIGFVVAGSRTVYFAGDTDLFPEMADLAPSIDLALLPVWGWGPNLGPGHLDPARAAAAAAVIAPGLAVPIHWGTFALPRVIRRGADPSRPAREFAALAARQVPPVRARVLAPGEQLEIEQPRGRPTGPRQPRGCATPRAGSPARARACTRRPRRRTSAHPDRRTPRSRLGARPGRNDGW